MVPFFVWSHMDMTKQFALDLFAGKAPRAGAPATSKIMRQPCHECAAPRVVVVALRVDDTAITFCSIDHAKAHGWPWLPLTQHQGDLKL